MSHPSELHISENGKYDCSNYVWSPYAGQTKSFEGMVGGNQQAQLVEWLNIMIPLLNLPVDVSDEELRAYLSDGTVLCCLMNKLKPGSVTMAEHPLENVTRFLAAVDGMGMPTFEPSDLEQGSIVPVLHCLWTLKVHFSLDIEGENIRNRSTGSWSVPDVESLEGFSPSQGDDGIVGRQRSPAPRGDKRGSSMDSIFQNVLSSSFLPVPDQAKQGCFADLSDAKISELRKPNSLNCVATQSLFNIINKILDQSVERKNGELPYRVVCLLRKVVQVIEGRISTQAENIRNQNILYKSREEKYRSRIRVLETLAAGTTEENEVVRNHLQKIKIDMTKIEEENKIEEQGLVKLLKEKNQSDLEISALRQDLGMAKRTYEKRWLELETDSKETKMELEQKIKEFECLLTDSRKKVNELEAFSESKSRWWKKKEQKYKSFMEHHSKALRELDVASNSIKQQVLKAQRSYSDEFSFLGIKLKGLATAAENYHVVLSENRKLYNEVQDLKGNIRVYCRIRPFLPGQNQKQTTIEYIGENGELVVADPLKHGKDSHRLFKFNKVFGPTATQEEVFLDTQPLIRSVLDGYNVCIFAYGQTGSGKTYTMTGPGISSQEDWGVNYRALNDLFHIAESRQSSISYEVAVQMVEIYNEQVRDLLSSDGPQKRLGIWSVTQPNGLTVPDASMHPVKSTNDVLELMSIGLLNRAVGATALNERSSRSHSVLTVHVRGLDVKTGAVSRGNLHLIDLAGSERVERSEAAGDRLKEAQHINKSLSALGDVVFALAQKSSHVPYRNSKLTQILQSSLGGQAKTLMFVQLNPGVESYSETISTLKFAKRVSGVELGAARSNKEGRDVKELMEQMVSLKDIIVKKDEEIERLRLIKIHVNGEKRGIGSPRHGSLSPSPRRHSLGPPRHVRRMSSGKTSKPASDADNGSEHSDKHSECGSQQSIDEFRTSRELPHLSNLARGDSGQNPTDDVELLGFGDADSEERLSDISDGGLSMGTETDGSISSIVEFTLFPETAKSSGNIETTTAKSFDITETSSVSALSKLPKPSQSHGRTRLQLPSGRTPAKASTMSRQPSTLSSSSSKQSLKRWQK